MAFSTKGLSPYKIIGARKPPSENRIVTYLMILDKWLDHWLRPNRTIGFFTNPDKAQKWVDRIHRNTFTATYLKDGKLLPKESEFKKVRFITNPYRIPDIGGKNGALTKYIKELPLVMGGCYSTAFAIAARFPEVNIVYGMYAQWMDAPKTKIASLDGLARSQAEWATEQYEVMKKEMLGMCKNLGNKWYQEKDSNGDIDNYLLGKDGTIYTWHAWCEYKGKHFDPYLWKIEKETNAKANWYSEKHGRFIHWKRYIEYRKSNFKKYTDTERKTIESIAVIKIALKSKNMLTKWYQSNVMFRYHSGNKDFPVHIPSRLKWMKDFKLTP